MLEWLRARREARPIAALTRRDRRRVGAKGVPEFGPHNRTYGYLLGVDRRDFERVNGYDMRFEGWGEEDVDIAVRLRRVGLRCGHAGPDGTLIHLWHESEIPAERPNWYLLQATERSDRIEAIEGLREVAAAEKGTVGEPHGTGREPYEHRDGRVPEGARLPARAADALSGFRRSRGLASTSWASSRPSRGSGRPRGAS